MKTEETISLNPKIYPLSAVYSASYVFLDKAYIFLDGNLEKEIIVHISPKDGKENPNLKKEFLNELLNFTNYKQNAEASKQVRQLLLQKALFAAEDSANQEEEQPPKIDDPEDIAIPWEEKYGKG